MNLNKNSYDLTGFLTNLHDWVKKFTINDRVGHFFYKTLEKKKSKPISLYGTTDMVFTLYITNELDNFYNGFSDEKRDSWIKIIQSFQNSKTGWFKQGLWNYYSFHFKEHSTAYAASALKLLRGKPKYSLKLLKKLNTKKRVEKWLKKMQWGLLFWPGSHRGGGVPAYISITEEIPHKNFFDWYFDWLDKEADPEVGFWRRGLIHKIKKNRLTKHELGGSIHFHWIYEFMKRPIPYPEKVIDSVLKLQNDWGLWDKKLGYCIDLDAIFCLTRCCQQTDGYRKEDIYKAIVKFLDYTIPKLNDRNFLFNNYQNTHRITGYLETIAEIQKFYPNLIKTPKPWCESLDIAPWI
ncbi:MAG: hypothetical protein ACFFCM_01195 [Promethearchaeota archaeon]